LRVVLGFFYIKIYNNKNGYEIIKDIDLKTI